MLKVTELFVLLVVGFGARGFYCNRLHNVNSSLVQLPSVILLKALAHTVYRISVFKDTSFNRLLKFSHFLDWLNF